MRATSFAPSLGAAREYAAITFVAVAARALARLSLRRLEAAVEPRRPPRARPSAEIERSAQRVERVLSWTTAPLRHTCMTRGITRYFFLRRAGAEVKLVFGVGKVEGEFSAHCWILRDGEVYAEKTDPYEHFTDMYTVPSR